jgi:3-hydroxyisobutyrate dehydrogenase-like beta-hydroxyacid dehydrogenase
MKVEAEAALEPAPCPPVPDERIGFFGLGDIGLPMAARLLDCGVPLVVINRTITKAAPLAERGAKVAGSVEDFVASSDVLITCLHGPAADREVYLAPGGLTAGDLTGKLVINTSTIGPDLAVELAAAVEDAGGSYVDCPLLGSGRYAAAAGTLVLPVSGRDAAVERALPVLRLLATTVEPVGAVGAAQVVKLAYNSQFAIAAVGVAQAIRTALRAGARPEALEEVLLQSGRSSNPLVLYATRMIHAEHQARGTFRTLAKDLDVANAYAQQLGQDPTMGLAAAAIYHAGLDMGLGELDVPTLVQIGE